MDKNHSRTSPIAWLMLISAVLLGAGAVSDGQTPQTSSQPGSMGDMMRVDEAQAKTLLAERQQIMAAMREMDQKLKDLVAKMDAAKGEAKIDAVAAVVRDLVTQRTQMSDRMMTMQGRMMGHMMQHMMSMQGGMRGMMNRGGQPGAMPSLESCPLMKGLTQEPGGSPSQKN